jgi:hypothetical protein
VNMVAAGRDVQVCEMTDRFAATLLAILVAAPASAQVMVDGPHLQETCSNPDEVRRQRAPASSARPSMLSRRCTSSAFGRSRRPRSSNAPSISYAVARTRSAATPASSRSSSRLRPFGHAPLRGPAWASPSIRPQGRASIWASIQTGAPLSGIRTCGSCPQVTGPHRWERRSPCISTPAATLQTLAASGIPSTS